MSATQPPLVKRLQRRPHAQQHTSPNSSAPEANLSKEASELTYQSTDAYAENRLPAYFNSFNESYLRSQHSVDERSGFSRESATASELSVMNYDSYPSIQSQSARNSITSNIDDQMHDLEYIYGKIAPMLSAASASQELQKSNRTSYIDGGSSQRYTVKSPVQEASAQGSLQLTSAFASPVEAPRATNKPLLQMFDNATNQVTQIVTYDSVVPVHAASTKKETGSYKNLPKDSYPSYAHTDNSYLQQEMLIKNLQQECNRLQEMQPKQTKTQLEINYSFYLAYKTREAVELQARIDKMAGEFTLLVKENAQMKQVLQLIIAELHGEDVEVSIKQLGEELLALIRKGVDCKSGAEKEEFYQYRIREAVVDMEAMRRLIDEKYQEIDRLAALDGSNLRGEIQRRDYKIYEQLTQIQALQTELFYAKAPPKQDLAAQAQIEYLNYLLQLAQMRQKQMEQQQFENYRNYDRFADERIETLRNGYQGQISYLQLKLYRSEQDNMRLTTENDDFRRENERLKATQNDDRLAAIEYQMQQQPLSNQLMERAVLAEKALKAERQRYERLLADNDGKLAEYEAELAQIIGDLENVL